jgi:hypothetical protein
MTLLRSEPIMPLSQVVNDRPFFSFFVSLYSEKKKTNFFISEDSPSSVIFDVFFIPSKYGWLQE